MNTPTPTKLAAHLAKFRYESPAHSPLRSPKREPIHNADAESPQTHHTPIKRKRDPELEEEHQTGSPLPLPLPRTTPPPTPAKVRKVKVNRTYASPETYAHLKAVPDLLRPGLKLVFCGIKSVSPRKPRKKTALLIHCFSPRC